MSELRSEETVSETTLSLDKSCYCWRCGYEWISRKREVPPAVCPRCRRDDWDIHRRFECRECGYVFRSADLTTLAYRLFHNCPKCRSNSWHKEIEDKLDHLYKHGVKSFHAENWQTAIEKFAEILRIKPGYKDAKGKCAQAQKSQQEVLSQLYQQGMEYCSTKKWSLALEKFEEILCITPEYKDVSTRRQKTQEAIREEQEVLSQLYQQGMEYCSTKKWSLALAKFEEILRITPKYKDVATRYHEAQEACRRQAETAGCSSWQALFSVFIVIGVIIIFRASGTETESTVVPVGATMVIICGFLFFGASVVKAWKRRG